MTCVVLAVCCIFLHFESAVFLLPLLMKQAHTCSTFCSMLSFTCRQHSNNMTIEDLWFSKPVSFVMWQDSVVIAMLSSSQLTFNWVQSHLLEGYVASSLPLHLLSFYWYHRSICVIFLHCVWMCWSHWMIYINDHFQASSEDISWLCSQISSSGPEIQARVLRQTWTSIKALPAVAWHKNHVKVWHHTTWHVSSNTVCHTITM